MKIENLRLRKLTFRDTFLFVKEVLFSNFLKFFELFCFWVIFSFVLLYVVRFFSDYIDALLFLLAYIIFYLFYLTFIAQSRAVIDKKQIGLIKTIKDVFDGFLNRRGLDLLELIPAVIVVFLIAFFPSNIFAIPLAFIITLATIIFVAWTILVQPVVVIKKIAVIPAIKYSISLISGYFPFVLGLIFILAIGCLIFYLPFVFIKTSILFHKFFILSFIGIEVMLFAIMLTIVYTNLEVAWSIGFKSRTTDFPKDNTQENNHEFTEFFNNVPEIKIEEENKDNSEEK